MPKQKCYKQKRRGVFFRGLYIEVLEGSMVPGIYMFHGVSLATVYCSNEFPLAIHQGGSLPLAVHLGDGSAGSHVEN